MPFARTWTSWESRSTTCTTTSHVSAGSRSRPSPALSDEELAAAAEAPVEVVPALRGARDLVEAREYARQVLEPEPVSLGEEARPTLERFRELRSNGAGAKEIVRELKAVGGNLKALRLALTGRERGPELWAIVAALPPEEALRRIDAAL